MQALQDDLMSWRIGWGIYGSIILVYFAAVKIVNFRLHRALGRDPVEEETNKKEEGPEGVSQDVVDSVRMADISDETVEDDNKEGSINSTKGATAEITVDETNQNRIDKMLEPPSFIKEIDEDVAKQGGVSLSRSSSLSTEGTRVEMTKVDTKQDSQGKNSMIIMLCILQFALC